MANLTIAVDPEVLRRARARALEQGQSLNALLRGYLDAFARDPRVGRATERLLALAARSSAGAR